MACEPRIGYRVLMRIASKQILVAANLVAFSLASLVPAEAQVKKRELTYEELVMAAISCPAAAVSSRAFKSGLNMKAGGGPRIAIAIPAFLATFTICGVSLPVVLNQGMREQLGVSLVMDSPEMRKLLAAVGIEPNTREAEEFTAALEGGMDEDQVVERYGAELDSEGRAKILASFRETKQAWIKARNAPSFDAAAAPAKAAQ